MRSLNRESANPTLRSAVAPRWIVAPHPDQGRADVNSSETAVAASTKILKT